MGSREPGPQLGPRFTRTWLFFSGLWGKRREGGSSSEGTGGSSGLHPSGVLSPGLRGQGGVPPPLPGGAAATQGCSPPGTQRPWPAQAQPPGAGPPWRGLRFALARVGTGGQPTRQRPEGRLRGRLSQAETVSVPPQLPQAPVSPQQRRGPRLIPLTPSRASAHPHPLQPLQLLCAQG